MWATDKHLKVGRDEGPEGQSLVPGHSECLRFPSFHPGPFCHTGPSTMSLVPTHEQVASGPRSKQLSCALPLPPTSFPEAQARWASVLLTRCFSCRPTKKCSDPFSCHATRSPVTLWAPAWLCFDFDFFPLTLVFSL